MIAWLHALLAPIAHLMQHPQLGIPLSLALWGVWTTVVWWRGRGPSAPAHRATPHDHAD